jgi:hypothetical protein
MARLFVTDRELRFISDITKELVKDVVGQKIYYYAISEIKTKTHDVYNEAIQKVYDNPIEIDALVEAKYHAGTKITEFGVDNVYELEVYIQWRDLVEKGIQVSVGDYFSYGSIMYEITDQNFIKTIYGQAEHKDGIKILGTRVRQSEFNAPLLGPTDISNTDPDAVQHFFEQQRGQSENSKGQTGDVRELQRDGVLESPLSEAREVSYKGDERGNASSFYGDE